VHTVGSKSFRSNSTSVYPGHLGGRGRRAYCWLQIVSKQQMTTWQSVENVLAQTFSAIGRAYRFFRRPRAGSRGSAKGHFRGDWVSMGATFSCMSVGNNNARCFQRGSFVCFAQEKHHTGSSLRRNSSPSRSRNFLNVDTKSLRKQFATEPLTLLQGCGNVCCLLRSITNAAAQAFKNV
jgi:hypothetical protein